MWIRRWPRRYHVPLESWHYAPFLFTNKDCSSIHVWFWYPICIVQVDHLHGSFISRPILKHFIGFWAYFFSNRIAYQLRMVIFLTPLQPISCDGCGQRKFLDMLKMWTNQANLLLRKGLNYVYVIQSPKFGNQTMTPTTWDETNVEPKSNIIGHECIIMPHKWLFAYNLGQLLQNYTYGAYCEYALNGFV